MKRIFLSFLCIISLVILASCNKEEKPIEITSENMHQAIDKVVEVMIHDIFSPVVVSRIFVYPDIAAYEIMALDDPNYNSLAGKLNGLKSIPKPQNTEHVNYRVAALIAHLELSKSLIFSEDRISSYQDSLYTSWKKVNETEFETSKKYAMDVVSFMKAWMDKDNYKQTRTMPKFTVDTDDPSRWQPTPPAYMDGIEPHWDKIRTLVIDSASQFKPIPPPEFSLDKDSKFFKEAKEVYDVGNRITQEGDTSDGVAIAQFWDCNPYVSVTKGHLMFATKKITPGAHWIGITKIACRKAKTNFNETVFAYTKTAIAIFDGFISCWDEKYRSNLIRPETVINLYIDENWKPILQTPPFPEYTSGHSVVSGAAAKTLTSIFGDNFSFDDDTETPYGIPIRSFPSFNKAADEAAMSRMYGGIHYRAAIEVGIDQGRNMAGYILNKLSDMSNEKIALNK
ncbi:vanadium-dependent haloperoxidase [Galbibacter pacificus]|uniref:Vanadium-dependent haloperoxidase n=1 Tax=Galbibacter pacificus TaxID=2996052 RepID=A0ABT6FWD5_9FLAO|nr:vanadium-dependent haloperoxidase [Galbibacter pacificus]MDG3583985.1 vanadium-dependent haloperoxidase [Galbibacter pacificus]MDG3587578.1 vanadium-dependent haloperoxidase [Galbibacter pacificus]